MLLYLSLHQYVKRLKVRDFRQSNDTESALPVPFMGTRLSKQGFTFSTNMLGNLSAKKNKITCNTE